jgi:SAM-dependent methyltransferase
MSFWMYRVIGRWFRRRRLRWFDERFGNCHTLVDLGGTVDYWKDSHFRGSITLLNLFAQSDDSPVPNLRALQGDACRTAFADRSFDLAFSNSVIEHVGGPREQRQFARELLRLAGHVYCQTPNKWFPLEPHYLGLFLHWLPDTWRTPRLHRWTTLNGLRRKPYEPVRLLTRKEFSFLFPGCAIKTERFLGLPKSFIAWK